MTPMLQSLSRRVGRFPIELPAAAMLAFAVAFVTLALPDWRFARMVGMTGLPSILSAAEPPLGLTARILVALVLAGIAFAAAWAGLRAIDQVEPEEEDDFPSFRAADLHPDAPRRRPILAGAEFGMPADDLPPIETQPARKRVLDTESLPSFLAPQPPEIGDFVPETSEPEPPKSTTREPVLREPAPDAPSADESVDPFLAPKLKPTLPSFMSFEGFEEEELPANSAVKRVAREPEDLPHLMTRFEKGLSRRDGKPVPGAAGPAREQIGRALDDLDRASARRR